MKERCIVLFSGGLDSTTLLYFALQNYEAIALTFTYGSKHNEKETGAAKRITEKLKVPHTIISLPFVEQLFRSDLLKSGGEIPEGHYQDDSMRRTVVPFRNGILLSIAVGYAESLNARKVWYAAHAGDHAIYPDCRSEFFQAIGQSAKHGTYLGVEIEDPFLQKKKSEIVSIGDKLKVPFSLTYSCYKGLEIHCGKCGTCVERKEAFREAGIVDPTDYSS